MSTELEFVPDPSCIVNRPGVAWSFGTATQISFDPDLHLDGFGGATVDNITALRMITGYYADEVVTVRGLIIPMDGTGGHYIFDLVSMAVDDGVTAVRPNDIAPGNPGMWLKYA
jgi:hypothetical protein